MLRVIRSWRATKTDSPAANTEVSLGIVDEAIYSIQPRPRQHQARVLRKRFGRSGRTSLAIHTRFTGYGEKAAIREK